MVFIPLSTEIVHDPYDLLHIPNGYRYLMRTSKFLVKTYGGVKSFSESRDKTNINNAQPPIN